MQRNFTLAALSLLSAHLLVIGAAHAQAPQATPAAHDHAVATYAAQAGTGVDLARKAIAPGKNFSAAIAAGSHVYLSGAIGMGADGKIVPGGIDAETRLVMDQLKATLAKAGLGMQDVVKATVYLRNPQDFAAMNAIYSSYFPEDPPARTTVVTGFPDPTVNVEIDMIAYRSK